MTHRRNPTCSQGPDELSRRLYVYTLALLWRVTIANDLNFQDSGIVDSGAFRAVPVHHWEIGDFLIYHHGLLKLIITVGRSPQMPPTYSDIGPVDADQSPVLDRHSKS